MRMVEPDRIHSVTAVRCCLWEYTVSVSPSPRESTR